MRRRIGRPPGEKLDATDLAFIKASVIDQCSTIGNFYKEFFDDASDPKYKGHRQPCNQETIEAAFTKFFRGDRGLPEWYWKVLEDSFSLTRSNLPSRNKPEMLAQQSITDLDASANNQANVAGDRPVFGKKPELSATNQDTQRDLWQPATPKLGRSLADWFGELSSSEILGYIKTIQFGPKKKITLTIDELRDPQCLNVMAGKFVYGPFENIARLYFEYRNVFGEILSGICAAIDANSNLRDEFYKNVAQADLGNIGVWLLFGADSFGEYALVHAYNIQTHFIKYAATPDFREHQKHESLQTACLAIQGFAKFDCNLAIDIIIDWCFEDSRNLHTAEPNELQEFASLIGRESFLKRLEHTFDPGRAAEIKQIITISSNKRHKRK